MQSTVTMNGRRSFTFDIEVYPGPEVPFPESLPLNSSLWNRMVIIPFDEDRYKDAFPTEEEALSLINNGYNIVGFSPDSRTRKVCLAAVKQDGMNLKYVPSHLHTEEIMATAFRQNGLSVQCGSHHKLTLKLMKIALRQNGLAIYHIGSIDPKLRIYAARSTPELLVNLASYDIFPHHFYQRVIYNHIELLFSPYMPIDFRVSTQKQLSTLLLIWRRGKNSLSTIPKHLLLTCMGISSSI